MLALRLNEGISLLEYNSLFNEDLLAVKCDEINYLINEKLIKISDDRLFTTYQGMLLLDMVTIKLM